MKEGRRARRIRRSKDRVERRWAEYLQIFTPKPTVRRHTDRPFSCGCRKRAHGAPRRDVGMCCTEERQRIYRWRLDARELQMGVRAGRSPLDE